VTRDVAGITSTSTLVSFALVLCSVSVAAEARARRCVGRPVPSRSWAVAGRCATYRKPCGAMMSEHTLPNLLTSCDPQWYRYRRWTGVVPLAGKGGRTAASAHAVATTGPSGSDSHAQDHHRRPQIDHYPARDASDVVRHAHGCRHCDTAIDVDAEPLHAADCDSSAADLRGVVHDWLPAGPQASPPRCDHCLADSQDNQDDVIPDTSQRLLTWCTRTANVVRIRPAREGSRQ
jgi:hypothetical protein